MGPDEFGLVQEAFASNWIAPLGPHVDAFEKEFAGRAGTTHAAGLSSGTAALHLAMRWLALEPGDEVICSSLTFSASVNPVLYERATPVFVDSDERTWNMDPVRLAEAVEDGLKRGRIPKAVVLVHLYGQSADIDPIAKICAQHGVPLIEDAAEALGATYKGKAPGSFGVCGVHSFNGNKIITTSGGGMLVSNDEALIAKARYWATQARDPAPHYEHSEVGFNYRMSNVLAAIGRGQLRVLEERVNARRANCAFYQQAFADLPGVVFMPEADFGRCTRWLTCITIDPALAGIDREKVRLALAQENIEARPVWKPMHLQPIFKDARCYGGEVSERLFRDGLCLPSGSNLTTADLERVAAAVRKCFGGSDRR
ncbi:MAG: DegT/DnrJ/EryC1/StrS family aminotransferase [Candidatus Didemnitutus sp.]|nr:DegT/DnrJ/EryC1/StrS family aminotransferase [Candidatus Didemnitutus sp.]